MGEQVHTPTPWRVTGKGTIRTETAWIASCNWKNKEANAALIVKAVNAHHDLVAALLMARKYVKRVIVDLDQGYAPHLEDIDAALAKAETPNV